MRSTNRLLSALAVLFITFGFVAAQAQESDISYSRDVRPIISDMCFSCHGPDEQGRKGELLLSDYQAALKGGESGQPAIVPGDPANSELIKRIHSDDPDVCMPPPHTKKKLSPNQVAILEKWIAAGGNYEKHWAFTPPTQPSVPKSNAQNPIDAFVENTLKQSGLSPTPQADKTTLLRRVSLDLIGLPPTEKELQNFLADPSEDAYEKAVERLLDSPKYGERWARKWLDLARYADTNGYEKDRVRSIWPYRDWVIRALNADMPFDQFTIEQIAGDLLPNPTLSQRIATGFHRNTMLNEEGGIDPLEFRFHAMVDRVATTGATWLGLTLQCCQCHTHKYDPITQNEYYAFMALLNNADELELEIPSQSETVSTSHPQTDEQTRQQQANTLLAALPNKWPIEDPNISWTTPEPQLDTNPNEPFQILPDHSILFNAPGPASAILTLKFPKLHGKFSHLRIEALTDKSLPGTGPGRTPHGNFVLSEVSVHNSNHAVTISSGSANVEQNGYPASAAFDSNESTGWAVHADGKDIHSDKSLTLSFDTTLDSTGDTQLIIRQTHGSQHTIGRLKVSFGTSDIPTEDLEKRRSIAFDTAMSKWIESQQNSTAKWLPIVPTQATSNLPLLTINQDASVFVSGDITKSDTYTLELEDVSLLAATKGQADAITAIRLEALPDPRLPGRGPGMAYYEGPKGDFLMGEFQVFADGQPVKIASASESYAKNTFGNQAEAKYAIDGNPETGWSCAQGQGKPHEAVFRLEQPTKAKRWTIVMHFGRHYACSLGKFRISVTDDPREIRASPFSSDVQSLLHQPNRTPEQLMALKNAFLMHAPELAAARAPLDALMREPNMLTSLVFQERPPENPRKTYLHHRGEWTQPTHTVDPDVLSILNPMPSESPKNRLAFAKWLVSRNNPLTARVVINRTWAAFFGRGIVKTQEDFGFQGSPPSHPQLLDWLAVQWMQDGWSMKQLHRRIVTSRTYKQSSNSNTLGDEQDPENTLLWRGPRVRLDAEQVRDAALHAAGLLSDKMYGPSVYPPQPASVTTEGTYGAMNWATSTGEDRYRRSLYTFTKRTAPFAFANTFDAPTGEGCIVRRDRSNTPLQALTMLNDVTIMEASQSLGKALTQVQGSDENRINVAYNRCFSRPATSDELAKILSFYKKQIERLNSSPQSAASIAGDGPNETVTQRAAWTSVVRALMNTDEFVTRR